MVYHGPSKGCNPCRKRRVRCDEARPFCGNCVKRKQKTICVYRNLFDAVHKDSTRYREDSSTSTSTDSTDSSSDSSKDQTVIKYNSNGWTSSRRATSAPLFAPPAQDPELDSLCFFFNNYVNIPRESQSNIFVEHILPLWKQAPENSPLRYAASATASNILSLWRMQGPDSAFSQQQYGKALVALRQAFQDPTAFSDDDVLGSMFMLDFFESVNRRYQQATDVDLHQRAAMALVKARGRASFKTETSRRLFTALRARYILFNLQARRKIDLDDDMLQEDPDIDLPGEKLDLILADLANTMYEGRHLFEPAGVPLSAGSAFPVVGGAPAHTFESSDETMTFETLLSFLLELNLRLNGWHASLPLGWARHRIPNARETLHHSIRAIGLYNDLCDVYSSMATAHAHNGWRTTKILILRLIKHCIKHLDPTSILKNVMPLTTIDNELQTLVDDICASIPFHLGSRTTLSLPHEHHEYPPVPLHIRASANYLDSNGNPTTMSDQDHIRSAAAIGGWFVLTPLIAAMRYAQPLPKNAMINTSARLEPLNLRPGQLSWITGQVKRIHKVYILPIPQMANTAEVSRIDGGDAAPPSSAPLDWRGQAPASLAAANLRTQAMSGEWLGGDAGNEELWDASKQESWDEMMEGVDLSGELEGVEVEGAEMLHDVDNQFILEDCRGLQPRDDDLGDPNLRWML